MSNLGHVTKSLSASISLPARVVLVVSGWHGEIQVECLALRSSRHLYNLYCREAGKEMQEELRIGGNIRFIDKELLPIF